MSAVGGCVWGTSEEPRLACIVNKEGGRGGRVILQEDAGLKARLVEEHVDVI